MSESLDDLLEGVVFADTDPRIQRLKAIWEEAKAEAEGLLEKASEEEYAQRKERYEIEQDPDPDGRALRETNLVRHLLREEGDKRLQTIWDDITRRVDELLREKESGHGNE